MTVVALKRRQSNTSRDESSLPTHHVLPGIVLFIELEGTGLTSVALAPVLLRIHVLVAGVDGPEGSCASFTFHPVATIPHVPDAFVTVAKFLVAVRALVGHGCAKSEGLYEAGD